GGRRPRDLGRPRRGRRAARARDHRADARRGRRRGDGPRARGAVRRRRSGPALPRAEKLMARRFQGLTRALGGGSIASVAYGEIGSRLFFLPLLPAPPPPP